MKSLSLEPSLNERIFWTRLSGSWHSILTSLRETFSPSAKTNSRNSTLLWSSSQCPSSLRAQSQRKLFPDSFRVDKLKEINFWNQWYLKYWSLLPLKSSFSSLSLPSKAWGWIQARLLFEKLISLLRVKFHTKLLYSNHSILKSRNFYPCLQCSVNRKTRNEEWPRTSCEISSVSSALADSTRIHHLQSSGAYCKKDPNSEVRLYRLRYFHQQLFSLDNKKLTSINRHSS